MAKEASELTKAIRSMLDETDGKITFNEARPKLISLGHEMPDEVGEKSEILKQWEDGLDRYEKPDHNEDGAVKALHDQVAKDIGLSRIAMKAVLAEVDARTALSKARNNFDVIKSIWGKNRKSAMPSESRKPPVKTKVEPNKPVKGKVESEVEPNKPVSVAKAPKTKTEPTDANAVIDFVRNKGGVASVRQKREAIETQIAGLMKRIETLTAQRDEYAANEEAFEAIKAAVQKAA